MAGISDRIKNPDYAQAIVNSIRDGLLLLDRDFIARDANATFYRMFDIGPEETRGRPLRDVGRGEWDLPRLRELLQNVLPRENPVRDFKVALSVPGGRRDIMINALRLPYQGPPELILMAMTDVTNQRDAQRMMQRMAHDLARAEHRERKRIAQTLHDELQQDLVALKMQLSNWRDLPAEHSDRVLKMLHVLDHGLAASRTLVGDLSPGSVGTGDVCGGLRALEQSFRDRYGLNVTIVEQDEIGAVDPGLCDFVYRSVRELLFNVVKHAQTDTATIRLYARGGAIHVVVEDEGVGCEALDLTTDSGAERDGLGLVTIRERLKLLGGELTFESDGSRGCKATMITPLE